MIRGIYTSISGVIAAQRRMDVLGNNMANVNTTGFKEALATQSAYDFGVGVAQGDSYTPLGTIGIATYASGLKDNWLQGALQASGIPTDLAVSGDGLFVVGTPSGPAYTRAGDFVIDVTGTLTTQGGEPVLDVKGKPVVVPAGSGHFTVSPDGTVQETGQRIALVAIPATGLQRIGNNLFSITGPVTPVKQGTGEMRQGFLEASNVDLAVEMTEMISVQRSYQLSARAFSVQDATLDVTNAIGRVK
jgi:flagellar basal-body rod protein FlgF